MQVIAKKRQKREEQGKSTQFRVRGQPVNDEKIDRWLKRDGVYGSSISKLPEASSRKYLKLSRTLITALTFKSSRFKCANSISY